MICVKVKEQLVGVIFFSYVSSGSQTQSCQIWLELLPTELSRQYLNLLYVQNWYEFYKLARKKCGIKWG